MYGFCGMRSVFLGLASHSEISVGRLGPGRDLYKRTQLRQHQISEAAHQRQLQKQKSMF